jgi:hypothetical protein
MEYFDKFVSEETIRNTSPLNATDILRISDYFKEYILDGVSWDTIAHKQGNKSRKRPPVKKY